MSLDLQSVELMRQSLEDASKSLSAQLQELEKLENEVLPPGSPLKASSPKFVMGRSLGNKIKNLHLREKSRLRKKTTGPWRFWYLWQRILAKYALWQVLLKTGQALKHPRR
jgi:hypothetical protein